MKEIDIRDGSRRQVVCVSNKNNDFFACDDNSHLLEVGKTYTVVDVIIHSWHTEIETKEFPNILFNSVCFCEKENN